MIVAVASRKASPGVTSLAVWLARFWSEPAVTRLVVEADPSGGTLAARWSAAHQLSWDPGLLALSTSRTALTVDGLAALSQRLADGLLVAAAPPAPDQVAGALARWAARGPGELAALPGLRAFVDCGRLASSSPALPLALRAELTILVCRPRLDEVSALLPGVAELTAAGCRLGLVCVGQGPYPPAEVAGSAGVELLGVLPADPRAADLFDRDGLDAGRAFRRSALAQTLAELAEVVRHRCLPAVGGEAPSPLLGAVIGASPRIGVPPPVGAEPRPAVVPAEVGSGPLRAEPEWPAPVPGTVPVPGMVPVPAAASEPGAGEPVRWPPPRRPSGPEQPGPGRTGVAPGWVASGWAVPGGAVPAPVSPAITAARSRELAPPGSDGPPREDRRPFVAVPEDPADAPGEAS